MTDLATLATLGIAVDATQVKAADKALDSLAATGAKAEGTTKKLANAQKLLGDATLKAAQDASTAQTLLDRNADFRAAKIIEEVQAVKAAEAAKLAARREAANMERMLSERNADFRAQSVIREMHEAQEAARAQANAVADLERRMDALRGSIDPTHNAQKRINEELREARRLYEMGAISASEYAAATRVLEGRQETLLRAQQALNNAHIAGAKGAGLQAYQLANLGSQISDVFVSLASGQNPMMVAIQQGSQIGGIFGTAKGGVGAVFKQLGGIVGRLAVSFAPLIAALSAVGSGFALAAREIRKETGDLTKGLGLTKEQLEDVKNKTVTMGDTMKATFQVVGRYIMDGPVGDALRWLGKKFGEVLDYMTDYAVKQTKFIAALFVGTYRGIVATWESLPNAFGELAINTANAVIRAVNSMVAGVFEQLNGLIDLANQASNKLGKGDAFDKLKPVALKEIENTYENGGRTAAESFGRGFIEGAKDAHKGVDKFFSDVEAQAKKNAIARILKEAGEGRMTKSEAEKEYERQKKAAESFIETLKRETAEIGLNAVEVRMLAVETAALAAQKAGLDEYAATIRKLGEDWKTATLNNAAKERLEQLEFENSLLGMNAEQRARATEKRALELLGIVEGTEAWKQYGEAILNAAGVKGANEWDIEKAQAYLDLLQQINEQTQDAAAGMADAFGNVGKALGGLITSLSNYSLKLAQIEAKRRADLKDSTKAANADAVAARARAAAEVGTYGDMASAAKGFFDEKSAGYKAMETAEKAFRAVEFALSVKAMLQENRETVSKIAGSLKRAAVFAAEAIANALRSLPFPFNLAAAAATGAALVAAGVSLAGGFGSGGASIPSAEERQDAQGTGSVLGDAKAKSESLLNAMEIVAKNTNRDLEYSNEMLKALRGIQSNIGAVAAAIGSALSVGGSLDTSKLNLGEVTAGPGLAQRLFFPIANVLPGLFGSKVTRTLNDQGLTFNAQNLMDLLANGVDGRTYQEVIENKKKKAFGITYSDKTKVKTTYGELDQDTADQITALIGSIRTGVIEAASVLGIEGAEATLNAFVVKLGDLSFKDMTGEEIERELNAIFGKLADDMALFAAPMLAQLQKVGEGAFETLARVAREYQVVNVSLQAIGMTFGAMGPASLVARQRLLDLMGGLDAFTEQTQFFAEHFLSDAERLAPIQSAIAAEMARLGLSGVKTNEQFKNLVLGLNLSTEAGAKMYAALMAVAPAFFKVNEAAAELVETARDDLTRAYEREAEALQATADKFRSFSTSLRQFRDSLYSGPAAALSPEEQYRQAKAAFESTAALALTGNEQALGDLQSVSEAYLNASKDYFASSETYFADLSAVREAVTRAEEVARGQQTTAETQLEQLKAQVEGLITINESVLSVADAIAALHAAMTAAGTATAPSAPAPSAPPVGTPQAPAPAPANENAPGGNSDVIDALLELRNELRAANQQRSAAALAHMSGLGKLLEAVEAQRRELARSS